MYIHEAVKKAMKSRGFISRKTIDNIHSYRPTRIVPTNTYENCIVYVFDEHGKEQSRCRNWTPSADDLQADDWEETDWEEKVHVHS